MRRHRPAGHQTNPSGKIPILRQCCRMDVFPYSLDKRTDGWQDALRLHDQAGKEPS